MLILTCPNCGPRSASEYRFGGEYNPRPRDPQACDDAEWADYLYLCDNKMGVQTEWWYHSAGCGTWFLAERHTKAQEIVRAYPWQPKSPGETQSAD